MSVDDKPEVFTWNDLDAAQPSPDNSGTPDARPQIRNQYQTVNVQCTHAKREIYKIKEFINKMTDPIVKTHALELFDRAYSAFDRLQAFIGSRG